MKLLSYIQHERESRVTRDFYCLSRFTEFRAEGRENLSIFDRHMKMFCLLRPFNASKTSREHCRCVNAKSIKLVVISCELRSAQEKQINLIKQINDSHVDKQSLSINDLRKTKVAEAFNLV